jgi:NAD(P)-dependent dehydrogenase (short-subunit alcohol dehydrogenase family)
VPPGFSCGADGVGLAADTPVSLRAADPGNTRVSAWFARPGRQPVADGGRPGIGPGIPRARPGSCGTRLQSEPNLTGFVTTTQLAIAQMLRQDEGGHVVQVTTSLVDHANSNVPSVLVSLTKGGLQSATKSLAIEFAKQGVRVNAVSPGIIQTPMHAPETYDGLAGLHPVGRMGTISDIVDGVLYLENAPFVTGEILHIDGGQSAGH